MVAHVSALRIRAWNPGIAGICEVFHARFADHAYPKHTHDAWTLFIVDLRAELAAGIQIEITVIAKRD